MMMSLFPSIMYHGRFIFVWNIKYLVRFLSVGVCLPCDHGLDFDISLCKNSINFIKTIGLGCEVHGNNNTHSYTIHLHQTLVLFFLRCPSSKRNRNQVGRVHPD